MEKKTAKKTKKKRRRTARPPKGVAKPRNWEKCILAAYMIGLNKSADEAAVYAGCSSSSIADWKKSPWWQDAIDEGHNRWLSEFRGDCKYRLSMSLMDPDQYAQTARWGADRVVKGLEPPTVRREFSGKIGIDQKPDGTEYLTDQELREIDALYRNAAKRKAELGGDKG